MNIFAKIKSDHDEARELMEKIIATPQKQERQQLFNQLKVAILSHAKSEEKTFYEEIKKVDEQWGEEVPHLKDDHKAVEKLFAEIDKLGANESLWWEKFGEVRMGLLHHMEEEEKQIFKDVKSEIPAFEATELGERMDRLEEKEKAKRKAA